jgi:N6-L-threonylcarbamoyladenine synthase
VLDFSYSGIKTAVLRYVQQGAFAQEISERRELRRAHPELPPVKLYEQFRDTCSAECLNLVASFQGSVVDDLLEHCHEAAEREGIQSVFVTGGVAANSELRERFAEFSRRVAPAYFPRLNLSTDNAAMIAAAAYPKFLAGEFAGLEITADASLRLA